MINVVEINNELGNGVTHPYIVWCTDGNKYVTKFPGNPEGTKSLINEYISSKLCEYLDLPIMKYNLIHVRKEDYSNNINPLISHVEGTAFGTIYDEYLLTVLNSGEIRNSINRNDAIKILIYDLLIGNNDRNKGNLMINSKSKKVIMIDHTHTFVIGVLWDSHQLSRFENEPFNLSKLNQFNYNNIINSIVYNDQFYLELNMFIKKVKSIQRSFVNNILDELPSDWKITKEEKESVCNFIINRFKRVDEILILLNIKGGGKNEV